MINDLNNFYIFGYNYKNHDIKKREKILKKTPEKFIEDYFSKNLINGYIVLNTCLRFEIYFYTYELNAAKIKKEINEKGYYLYNGLDAVRHLFNLACGLDSIIIGENEILSQLKKFFFQFRHNKKTCSELNTIFNHAVSVGKKFRHLSKISNTGVSLEYIVFKYIKKVFPELDKKTILLIGTGDIIRIILCTIKKESSAEIILTNRTRHKMTKFINDFSVDSIDFSDKYKAIKKADIIISATSAPHYVITKEKAGNILSDKKQRIFIDLAVPRDIEEDLAQIQEVTIFNLEDIMSVSSLNMDKRKKISEEYKYLIDQQQEKLLDWFKKRKNKIWIKEKKSLLAQEEAS